MTRAYGLIPLLFCVLLVACESAPRRAPVTPQPMACAGDIPAQITLYSPTDAKLTMGDQSYALNRIETASGVKYGNDEVTYWNKGIDAMIIRSDGTTTSCTYIPKSGL